MRTIPTTHNQDKALYTLILYSIVQYKHKDPNPDTDSCITVQPGPELGRKEGGGRTAIPYISYNNEKTRKQKRDHGPGIHSLIILSNKHTSNPPLPLTSGKKQKNTRTL